MKFKITVITVCCNEKFRLKSTIESVRAQTYPDMEYLIVDGASSDGTINMMDEYSEDFRIRFFSEKDYGIYNAMNRGIARASGDYIVFINAGDRFYNENTIADMVSYFKDNNVIYYGKTCLVYPDGLKKIQDFSKQEGSLEEKLLNGFMPNHQAIFAPRGLLTDHYFRESYQVRADYEWLLYSVSKGYQCESVPVVVSCYDMSGMSSRMKNAAIFQQESKAIQNEYRTLVKREEIICRKKDIIENEQDGQKIESKYRRMFQFMNYWMTIRQKGISLGKYFQKKGYKDIAIYGIGSIGLRLLEELKEYNIEIRYAVDRNAAELCLDMRIITSEETLEEVGAMIVTAISDFNEIKEQLRKKVSFPIVSLEDIVYEAGLQC